MIPVAHLCERVDKPQGESIHNRWSGTGDRASRSTYTV